MTYSRETLLSYCNDSSLLICGQSIDSLSIIWLILRKAIAVLDIYAIHVCILKSALNH